ncbi:ATP-dependent DNA helicase RecG [bacterium]|nr:ATP-dependent DNA helicase RecG [bacterium]
MDIQSPESLNRIPGIANTARKQLERLGVFSISDLLYTFPRTYQDRRVLPPIRSLRIEGSVTIYGVIADVSSEETKHRTWIIKAHVTDRSGTILAVFFNQPFLRTVLKPGLEVVLSGKMERNSFSGILQLTVADLEIIRSSDDRLWSLGRIVPVYPLVQGLYGIKMRQYIRSAVRIGLPYIRDYLPEWLRSKLNLCPLPQAIESIHFPDSPPINFAARQRLVFDEFFRFQLGIARKRNRVARNPTKFRLSVDCDLVLRYLNALPYRLTKAQLRVIKDIGEDIQSGRAMNRLIQGDVGSGKTDVAVVTLLTAIDAGMKGAIMAPTEVLAEQHYLKFSRQLEPLGVQVALLKGNQRSRHRKAVLEALSGEKPVVVVGTHALLEPGVVLRDLAVVIIDEQHRFGVMQRMRLAEKGMNPHCLFTTATPIPRTFTLTLFGDLDKSIIDEMPPGRIPIETITIRESQLPKLWMHCRTSLLEGRQLYVVYPLIEESAKLDLQSAIMGFDEIRQSIFPDFRVGLVHGRMSGAEKTAVMAAFKSGEIQVLVATTVIEVGVDVPNASMMIIMNAERFGLSQLHQLRGRVGRGQFRSSCYLVATPKSEVAKKRIDAMVATTDGFELAELDPWFWIYVAGPVRWLSKQCPVVRNLRC